MLCISSSLVQAETKHKPKPGETIGDFSFKDIRYLPRTLKDFGQPKVFVVVFTTTGCPLVQRYLPKLNELSKTYAPRGVQFIAINEGLDDTIKDVAYQALEFGVEFPFVKDTNGSCARAVGATRTPEVAVLDANRRLRYRGRIDNQYRLGGARPSADREELKRALEELLEGRNVSVKETTVDGCAITFPDALAPNRLLTYARDIAPLINKHCVECHRPGTEAPFALTSYDKVAAKATMIAEAVTEQRMPPWFAHPDFGTFVNQRGLTAEERDTIVQWAQGARAAGDLSQAPTPPAYPDTKWRIGEPDLIVTALRKETLPPTGYIDYRYILLPYPFTNDTWVQGIQIQPANSRVLHHANLAAVQVGQKFDTDRNFLTGRVPGGNVVDLTNGLGMLIPKGSVLAVQAHYVTTGKPETDQISVGLRFAKEPISKRVHYKIIGNYRFEIPPGAPTHRVSAQKELEENATGIALFSHMHLRGKDSTFIAHYPDDRDETLLVLPNYSFAWQMSYVWEPGKQRFPKGTRIECLSHFDNSPFNPYNPDPKATVRNGPQTHDEMMQGFLFYTIDSEHLDIRVDPRTGQELASAKESSGAQ
jgi:thiol-disulfide isomerase/thioredoxin